MFTNLTYHENLDEIHTSEAYFGKVLFFGKNLLIPYINLGISNHKLNESTNLKFIDYCYFIAVNIYYLKINENIVMNSLNENYDSLQSIYLGGADLIENQLINDIELQAENIFLQLKPNSKLEEKFWTPIKTPHFNENMDKNMVRRFVNNENLPEDLLQKFQTSL